MMEKSEARAAFRPALFRRLDREVLSSLPAAGSDGCAARAEFFLCLARAFAAPQDEVLYDGITRYLAADLTEIAGEIGYPVSEHISALERAAGRIPGHLDLLQLYSGLFLSPPAKVDINAGMYLDGVVFGPSEYEMERRYAHYGLRKGDDFRDLSDHLSAMLEFLAFLWGKAGRGEVPAAEAVAWCRDFLKPWLPAFANKLAQVCAEDGVSDLYLRLARIVLAAIEHDVAGEESGSGSLAK